MEEGTQSQRKSCPVLDTWKMEPFLILPQTSHLTLHKAFLSPDRAVERLSCGWWCLGQLVPCKCDQPRRIQNLAFGFPSVPLCKAAGLPPPVCALLCIHGGCADWRTAVLHTAQKLGSGLDEDTSFLQCVGSMFPGDHRTMGCCVTEGRCQLWGSADQGVQIFTCSR